MRTRWVVAWILATTLGCLASGWLALVVVITYALTPVDAIAHLIGA